jgi:predicted 2-oxoglutarate/Fe(II)-dependent dioxygenase YbiX
MNHILIAENFLPKLVVDQYTEFVKHTDLWEKNGDGIWNNRSLNLYSMPAELRESVLDHRISVKNKIQQHFSTRKELYADIFQFVRWREGDCLDPPHADAESTDGTPHPFPYRNFAAIIYLNSDFEGGRISFPNFDNFCPEIKPGMLVAFPGTLDYLHGVSKVTSGNRYTIAGFFTHNPNYADSYRI